MSPKQQTMHDICNLLDADAKKDGMGLDREMFSKKNMRQTHKFLLSALENMRRARQKGCQSGSLTNGLKGRRQE